MDEYGTQQPIALLKLLLEKGFLYDRGKELNCKNIRDLGFIAAMGKAGGGRNEVDPRFLSLFSVFNVPFPSEASLHLIYFSILKGHTSVRTGVASHQRVPGAGRGDCAPGTRPPRCSSGCERFSFFQNQEGEECDPAPIILPFPRAPTSNRFSCRKGPGLRLGCGSVPVRG